MEAPKCKVCKKEINNNLKICVNCNEDYHKECGDDAYCKICLNKIKVIK